MKNESDREAHPARVHRLLVLGGVLLAVSTVGLAQQRKFGLVADGARYSQLPPATALFRGPSSRPLPAQSSLRQYTPTPGDQEDYNTCPAWAAAYCGFTCLIASQQRKTSRTAIDSMAFSAPLVYRLACREGDEGCQSGISLIDALDVLVNTGAAPFLEEENGCLESVPSGLLSRAGEMRLSGYKKLFDPDAVEKATPVKRSIAAGKPVVIGLFVARSFLEADEQWVPDAYEYQRYPGPTDTAHAVTVIGYDDGKFGGAFEVMNSFGTSWGEDGYTWITYGDFTTFCFQAFELILDPVGDETVHLPISEARSGGVAPDVLAGSIEFSFLPQRPVVPAVEDGRFRFDEPFTSGDMFRLIVTAQSEGYVYAFASDDTYHRASQIFPDPQRRTNPHIVAGAAFCLPGPGPGFYSALDSTAGTDYLCFLFSRHMLQPNEVMARMNALSGDFLSRVKTALAKEGIREATLTVQDGVTASFAAVGEGSVVPILFELQHRAASGQR